MNERRFTLQGRGARVTALAAGVVAALGVSAAVLADVELQPDFGFKSLARQQVVQLNVVLVPRESTPPDPNHPGCRVTLSFVDKTNQELAKATVLLRYNVAAAPALRLRAADVLAPGEVRKPIRAVVNEIDRCHCIGRVIVTREYMVVNGPTLVADTGGVFRDIPNPPDPFCRVDPTQPPILPPTR